MNRPELTKFLHKFVGNGVKGWGATSKLKLRCLLRFSAVFEAPIEMTASQCDNRVSATNRPKHAGVVQTETDEASPAGFDHTRSDEQMLATELWVAHTLGIALEAVGLDADLSEDLGNA